jgi:hypothetical protein
MKRRTQDADRGQPRLSRKQRDMDIDLICGTLTHRLTARMLNLEQSDPGALNDYEAVLLEQANAIVTAEPGLGTHRSRTNMRVVTAAAQYLRRYRPNSQVLFIGTEVMVPDGRVDIAWEHPTLGVFFDELKTTRHHETRLVGGHLDQVEGYVWSGVARYGSRFAGVRYIPLLHPANARWVTARGDDVEVAQLGGTPVDFSALRGM